MSEMSHYVFVHFNQVIKIILDSVRSVFKSISLVFMNKSEFFIKGKHEQVWASLHPALGVFISDGQETLRSQT